MALMLKIAVTGLKIIFALLVIGIAAYGQYVRGGYAKREHKAGVQTLFSGDK